VSSRRNFGLDVLRSSASISVMALTHGAFFFYHLWPNQRALWYVGSLGMDMFFVLSGFLIGGILLDSMSEGRDWVRRFWMRRWIRTLPNYYVFLVLNIVIWWYSVGPVPDWPKYLFFLQNLVWVQSPFYPESWSLALEEMFYLVAPLLFLALMLDPAKPKRTLNACALVIAIGIATRYAWVLYMNPVWDDGVKKVVVARIDAIAYGVFAVQWFRYARPSDASKARLAIGGTILVLIAAVIYLSSDENTSVTARVVPFALQGAGFAMMLPWFAGLDGSRAPGWYRVVSNRLAVWSYSWYVIHLVVMRLMDIVVPGRYGWAITTLKLIVFITVSLVWSWANYTFVEKPILVWRNRRIGGSEVHIVPAGADDVTGASSDAARLNRIREV
jgi:peptidoglycan/LPS O-acetylase OafA/YrhL